MFIFILIALNIFDLAFTVTPPFITKCKPNDNECIKENTKNIIPIFAAGLPEYKVEKLDPMYIKAINASKDNLLFEISEATATGLGNCEVRDIRRELETPKFLLKLLCTCKLEGQYVLKGSLLVIPIEGKGRILVDMNSAVFNVEFYATEKEKKDGSKYWFIKSFSHTFDFEDQSNVVFENLYDGNEVLGRAAKDVLQNNGNEIIKDIGGPVITYVIGEIVKNINHMFKATTVEDLTL